ncbi:hypothetical protein [Microbacterium aurantiacum]|uniref:YqaJ viral recombinase domain-containing protein n=1 Tax=Microbacterium aurantiacum TaxID=162393 RepID=A0ABT8FRH8_9MICO|nr:hypothetical protein [Microbacterium aurantiacum]MDN4463922.1 hypothetical protein [Microbacterium aurantiacum]
MSTQIAARVVVEADAPREEWMAERGEGVTASQAWRIARGGIKARRTIVEEKMNGSRFRGNAATRAGSSREDALLDEAAEQLAHVEPNRALWGAAANDLHRATPDGIGWDADGCLVVIEVKSHEYGWEHDDIPLDHRGQLQWQMHVLGASRALYGFEVRDEDDQPPRDGATWIEVERDEEMIAWLVDRADAFIAWREDGCPDVDDLPDDVAEALAAWTPLKRALDDAAKAEKTANDALKKVLVKQPHAQRFGSVGTGKDGGYQLTVSETVSIDEAAWKEADPEEHARIEALRVELAITEAAAKRTHPKITRRPSLRYQEA